MALMKYSDILVLAKDKIKEVMAPLRAREMRKKAELEIAKLESIVAEKEQKIQECASAYPVDFDKLIDALDDLELTRRKVNQLGEIVKEMFAE